MVYFDPLYCIVLKCAVVLSVIGRFMSCIVFFYNTKSKNVDILSSFFFRGLQGRLPEKGGGYQTPQR